MNEQIDKILYDALEEEIPTIDVTTDHLIKNQTGEAIVLAKENGVISGVNIMVRLFQILDDDIYIKVINHDGTYVEENDIIAIISGNINAILKGKQLALNFMRRMSGIATKTANYISSITDRNIKLIDSNNTTPNFRALEKLAVTHGGGMNCRHNLSEQVSVKHDHIDLISSIQTAVEHISAHVDQSVRIEVEVSTFEQFIEVNHTKCDIIIFRDMTIEDMKKCCSYNSQKLVGSYATNHKELMQHSECSLDFILVDDLTHSYKLFDIELTINK